MKKPFLFCTLYFVLCIGATFAYTSDDLANANSLADEQIIMKQTIASKYGLDNKILRQEVIAMALKIKGITVPTNTPCKKYFTDATKNDWVCRAVELAADSGIITKANKNANPGKYVTRAEALAMMMKAANIFYDQNIKVAGYSSSTPQWQIDIVEGAVNAQIISTANNFGVNTLAKRSEVFGFAKNIVAKYTPLPLDKTYSNQVISFQYPGKYFDPTGTTWPEPWTLKDTNITTSSNEIIVGSIDPNGAAMRIKFYMNVYTDAEILKALGYDGTIYDKDIDCKGPKVVPKNIEGVNVKSFYVDFEEQNGICDPHTIFFNILFPEKGVLVQILLGQDYRFVPDGLFKDNYQAGELIGGMKLKELLESFKVVTK